MATVYVATTGNDSNSYAEAQDDSTPWATPQKVNLSAQDDDIAIIADGTYSADGTGSYIDGRHRFQNPRSYRAANPKQVILTGTDSDTVGETLSNSFGAGEILDVSGIVFQADSGVNANAFETSPNTDSFTAIFRNCSFLNGAERAFKHNCQIGILQLIGCYAENDGLHTFGTTALMSDDGDQVIDIIGGEYVGHDDCRAINIEKDDSLTYTLAVNLTGFKARLDAGADTGTGVAVNVQAVDPVISNFDITVTADSDNTSGKYGLLVRGVSASTPATTPGVSGGVIRFLARGGYGLAFGLSGSDANITGGKASGTLVIGLRDVQGSTPHNILFGEGSDIEAEGLKSWLGGVGFLASICDDHYSRGHLALDNNTIHFYAKGTTAGSYNQCTAVVDQVDQAGAAIFACAPQDATDTTAFTFSGGVSIVTDVTKINALEANYDANQGVTFENMVHLLPEEDDIDISNDDLFAYNATGGAANATLSEWNTGMSTNSEIRLLPRATLKALAQTYRNALASTTGGGGGVGPIRRGPIR
jgi:hypothetical protein